MAALLRHPRPEGLRPRTWLAGPVESANNVGVRTWAELNAAIRSLAGNVTPTGAQGTGLFSGFDGAVIEIRAPLYADRQITIPSGISGLAINGNGFPIRAVADINAAFKIAGTFILLDRVLFIGEDQEPTASATKFADAFVDLTGSEITFRDCWVAARRFNREASPPLDITLRGGSFTHLDPTTYNTMLRLGKRWRVSDMYLNGTAGTSGVAFAGSDAALSNCVVDGDIDLPSGTDNSVVNGNVVDGTISLNSLGAGRSVVGNTNLTAVTGAIVGDRVVGNPGIADV